MRYRFAIIEARDLRPHEALIPELLEETRVAIEREGFVKTPILVENRHHIILDGHHRYQALLDLGCSKVPVFLVDYYQEDIEVKTWPGAILDQVTKDDVVAKVLDGEVFPPKTTRHVLHSRLEEIKVQLEELM